MKSKLLARNIGWITICKEVSTTDHLISMLFSTFAKCTSLREVATSMLGLNGKMKHFQLKSISYRSSLSDANKRRSHHVFDEVYYPLLKNTDLVRTDSKSATDRNTEKSQAKMSFSLTWPASVDYTCSIHSFNPIS